MFERGERARVQEHVARQGHDRRVVARVLPLGAQAAREPPRRRVVEEQDFRRRLQKVDQVVVAPYVRQLVREHGLQLPRR